MFLIAAVKKSAVHPHLINVFSDALGEIVHPTIKNMLLISHMEWSLITFRINNNFKEMVNAN